MKKFALTTKLGEVITNVICENLDDAIDLFAEKKKLERMDLLKIFSVKEI